MDRYLVAIAFIFLCLEAGWLAEDLNLVEFPWLKSSAHSMQDSLGQVTTTKRQVRRRSKSSLVWEETRKAEPLFAYDSVLTLEQSAAEVSLNAGTKITLYENTLVTIEPPDLNSPSDGPVRLKFKRGVMRTAGGRAPSNVDTGSWIVEADRDSQITIRSSGDDKFEVESHSGTAKIVSAEPKNSEGGSAGRGDGVQGQEKILKPGETVELQKDQLSEVKTALNVDWLSPTDGERFYTHEGVTSVPIRWRGEVDAVIVQKAETDTGWNEPVNEGKNESSFTAPVGQYVIRMHSKDQATFARTVSVWAAPKIYLLQPLPRQRIRVTADVELVWTAPQEAAKFKWQVAVDEGFKNIVKEGETDSNSAIVNELGVGQYYWRVLGFDDQGFVIPPLYSNPFVILQKPLEAPKLKAPQVRPEDDEASLLKYFWNLVIPRAAAAELDEKGTAPTQQARPAPNRQPKRYSARFEWEPVEGASGYSIEISETADFRSPVVAENVKRSHFVWKNFKLGQYYWRVAAQDSNGDLGLFSEVANADLHTIPEGIVTPAGIVAKPKPAADSESAERSSTQAAPALVKTPAAPPPEPQATSRQESEPPPAESVQKPAPNQIHEEPPQPRVTNQPYRHALSVGGYYEYRNFKANDFKATQSGVCPCAIKAMTYFGVEDSSHYRWRAEFELEQPTLKIGDHNAFPFQSDLTSWTGRATLLADRNLKSTANWGLTLTNQFVIFQRADLEALSATNPLVGGPIVDWTLIEDYEEQHFRLGAFGGSTFVLEASGSETYFFATGDGFKPAATIELRFNPGVTSSGSWWYGGSATLFLGGHW